MGNSITYDTAKLAKHEHCSYTPNCCITNAPINLVALATPA